VYFHDHILPLWNRFFLLAKTSWEQKEKG
jgi:hypothetical protein